MNYGDRCWYTGRPYKPFSARLAFSTRFKSGHPYHSLFLDDNMKVKDFTFGILIIVIALFPLSIVNWFITPKEWWVLPFIIILIFTWNFLFALGWKIAFEGIEIDANKR